jgi:hypothetical protein
MLTSFSRVRFSLPLLMAAAVLFSFSFPVLGDAPSVLYVDDDASGKQDGSKNYPFRTISQAIDLVEDNDATQIYVASGKYEDNFNIPEDAQVIGAGAEKTRIESDNDKGAVVYMEHGTRLSGVTVRGAEVGVLVKKDSRAEIFDSIIEDNDKEGIFLSGTNSRKDRWKISIANAVIRDNGRSGIYANGSPLVIIDSTIQDNRGNGITLSDDVKLWLEDTHIKDNKKSGLAGILDGSDMHIIDCEFNDNGREGIEINAYGAKGYMKIDNTNFDDNDRWGIARVSRNYGIEAVWKDVVVKKNAFEGNASGSISPIIVIR